MDGDPDGDFLFLAHAERFYHLGVPLKPFTHPYLYGVGGNAVRLYVDDVLDFRNDGTVWEESALYRHPEIFTKNRVAICVTFSMERDCVFYGVVGDFPALSKGGVAGFLDCCHGLFVYHSALFLEQAIHGGGNKGD